MLQIDNERLLILWNTLEVKDIREGKTDRLKAPSGSPREDFVRSPFSFSTLYAFWQSIDYVSYHRQHIACSTIKKKWEMRHIWTQLPHFGPFLCYNSCVTLLANVLHLCHPQLPQAIQELCERSLPLRID